MTNLLSKAVIDQIPDRTKKLSEEIRLHGLLVDGTMLVFYGTIQLPIRVSHTREEEIFMVSQMTVARHASWKSFS